MPARLRAILRQRCPVCLEGPMFRGRFAMNPTCPVCGHRFEREAGFFQGAMYLSYGFGTAFLIVLGYTADALLAPSIGFVPTLAGVVAVQLALVPTLFRYSRVIWAHLNIGTLVR
jgi:uncharacterized protein (DUF983 family)